MPTDTPLTPDAQMKQWREGWAVGVQWMRHNYRTKLSPWVRLRRDLKRLVADPALNQSERSAYRQVLRLMSRKAKAHD